MPTVNGVGSGLDIEALIKASLIYRQTAVKRLQAKQAMVSAQQGAVLGLKSRVSAFKSAAEGIKDLTTGMMVAYNEGEGLLLTADSTATPGSHDVIIHSMAQAHRIAAAGVADRNSTAIATSTGSFKIRIGDGETLTVTVDAATTLEDLVERINSEEGGSVKASIVNDGSKATSFRMVLTSTATGGDNVISITQNDTTLNFTSNAYEQPFSYESNSSAYTGTVRSYGTFTGTKSAAYLIDVMSSGGSGIATYRVSLDGGVSWDDNSGDGYATSTSAAQLGGADTHKGLQISWQDAGTLTAGDRFELDAFNPVLKEARDAFVEVDGVAVRSSGNSITEALQGVSLDLKKADVSETQKVTIKRTTSGISTKLSAFVSAYNDIIGGIRDQQKYDPDKKQAGTLLGDQVANRIVFDISSAVSQNVAGVTGTFSNLSEIGITVNENGHMSLDSSQLSDSIEADAASVLEVLEGATTASTTELETVSVPSTAPADSYSVIISQSPTQARVSAGAAMAATLTGDEVLNFTYSSDANQAETTNKIFQVSLTSGSTLAEVIAQLNDDFKAQGTDLIASDESGALMIQTTEYGSDMKFTVFSDLAAAAGTTQIGSSATTGLGVDIEGAVGGFAATGIGALLNVEYGELKGMKVKYTGSSTGVVGTLSVVQGAASNFSAIAGSLMDEDNGAIAARDKALQNQIESIQRRIDERRRLLKLTETRVRKRYVALDVSLGRLKAQGDAMMGQLATMMAQSTNNQ